MSRLSNWLRRGKLESSLIRELSYHRDRRVADLIRRGLSEQEAHRQAVLELGGIPQIQEEVRDVWLTRWLRDFFYDLRFSLRSFRRSPTFTATVVLSLALGIGATTAIYSLVDQVLLHALPVRQPERLVLIDWKGDSAGSAFGSYNLMSYPLCRDLEQQERFFEGVLCRTTKTVNLSTGGEPIPTLAEIVSGSYFSTLGVSPALGRVIDRSDDGTPGSGPVVVLSYDYWKAQLAGAQDIVGRKVLVNQYPMTVVGVAAPLFRGIDVGEVPALWIPASMSSVVVPGFTRQLDRRTRWLQVLGRLKPGITAAQAQAGLQPWFKALLDEDTRRVGFPKITPERLQRFFASTLQVTPAPQGHSSLRRSMSQPLWVLLATTAVLLALACLNVAGLFLARGSAREREVTTRLALGASRGRIGRQLLADSLLLAFTGGLLGIALAPLAIHSLISFLPRDSAGNALHASLDSRLLLFAFLASLTAGILSGLVPALQAGRDSLISSLRARGGGVRLRKAIVTAQIAFSLVLVIGAALFIRTLIELMSKGPGFTTSSLISFGIDPLRNGYSRKEASQVTRRIYTELRAYPVTRNSAVASMQLLTGGSSRDPMTIQASKRIVTGRDVNMNSITPDFFTTLGVKMIAGRDFDERDSLPIGQTGRHAAIVNEAFVRQYLSGRNPLGVLICAGDSPDAKPDIPIVGVVADFRYRGVREEAEQAYFPFFEGEDVGGTFYVKVPGEPRNAFLSIQAIVQRVDPELPLSYIRTVDDQVGRSLITERLLAALSGAFGTLALLLSLVGLYGIMSFVVTQRTREIGIRLALGETGAAILWLILRDALIMVVLGTAVALPIVAALGRLVESQLYGVKPGDPFAIATATVVLITTSLLAALIPAYRAMTVNPVEALRFE